MSTTTTEAVILLSQFAATWAMVGLIWLVQVVQYPLLKEVGTSAFRRYHEHYTRLVSRIVGPLMLVEFVTTVVLMWRRPPAVPKMASLVGFLLILVIWVSTALLQVPQHNRLAYGFESGAYRKLVITNWLRTIAWSLRGLLTAWMVSKAAGVPWD